MGKISSKTVLIFLLTLFCFSCREKNSIRPEPELPGEEIPHYRVLHIDSYSEDLPRVKGILWGIESVLLNTEHLPFSVELSSIHMDTNRNPSERFKTAAALRTKDLIQTWEPDAVILSDDNAVKYVLIPYFLESDIPFVFCGVNWEASLSDLSASNTAGMIEVQLIRELVEILTDYSDGTRVAFLKGDDSLSRKEGEHFRNELGYPIQENYVRTFQEWRHAFVRLQDESDILIMGNLGGVFDWDGDEEALDSFLMETTEIPTGSLDLWMVDKVLVTSATYPEEQGEWAAERILEILGGRSPADIPLVRNKRASIHLNMPLARKLGIKFPMSLIDKAHMEN